MAFAGADDEPEIDIDRLEQRIETLSAEVLRCRKFALAARIMIGAGAAGLALMLLGALSFGPELMLGALAAVIGGVVLLGSNASTWAQTEAALQAAEEMRRDLIARMPLRIVGEERPTLH
jgi:hypothetical protein